MGNCSNASNNKRRERMKNQQNAEKENIVNNGINSQSQVINIVSSQNQLNQTENNSNLKAANNNSINYYLICPDCQMRSPHIEKLYYDDESKDFLVKYTCICSNDMKQKEIPLMKILSNKEPLNLCILHTEQKLIAFCKNCKRAICNICKNELHQNHNIDMDIINKSISKEDADNMLKIIKEKEQQFNLEIDKNEQKMENGIDNMIQKLNEEKINYKKQLENYKDNNQKTFDFLKNLYCRYINNFDYEENKNNENIDNNINNDIMLANHINNFAITNSNMPKLNSNIDEIINQFKNEQKDLKLNYDYGFYKNEKIYSNKESINCNNKNETEKSINYNNTLSNKNNSINNYILTNSVNNSVNNNILNINKPLKNFICIKTLKGHTEKIVSLLELSSGLLATGSYDNTIRIWNINNDKEDIIIKENENSRIFCLLEFEQNKILCGTSNNVINLWDINSLGDKCIYSFQGHSLWINCLVKINNKYFASASNDTKIKIWDYYNRKCLKTLDGHVDCILSLILLQKNNNYLCSGSADLTVRIWDWENNKCLYVLKGHEKWVKCLLELDNGIIVTGSDDKSIKLWKNEINIKTIEEHTNSVRTFCQINSKYFASGSFDCTIKIWEINSWVCVQTLVGHDSNVICIISLKYNNKNGNINYSRNPTLIASCSNDKTLKIWEENI